MELSPDQAVIFRWGPVILNETILFTWIVMALIVIGARIAIRSIARDELPSRPQSFVETVVTIMTTQIRQITHHEPRPYLPFIGALYLLIAVANFLSFIPAYHPPTASLSTTAALAVCVFLAVPAYGIASRGVIGFVKHYLEPTPFMLPFHLLGEISRTVALAIRLFGNMMSGSLAVAILLLIAPLFFPVLLQILELLIGQVQAYIFAVLATVYIASAARTREAKRT